MLNNVIIFVALFACWYIFSGENGGFYIVTGIFSCLLGVLVSTRLEFGERLGIKPSIVKYWAWLSVQIVISGIDVALRVWKLRPLAPVMEEIPTSQNRIAGHTIYGNSITLTPGTVIVDIDQDNQKIIVHALSKEGMEVVKSGEMDRRVKAVIREVV